MHDIDAERGYVALNNEHYYLLAMNHTRTLSVDDGERIEICFKYFKMYGEQGTCASRGEFLRFFDGEMDAGKPLTKHLCGGQ